MDVRAFDAPAVTHLNRRTRRAHRRRHGWSLTGRSAVGYLAVGATLTVAAFGLRATTGSVGIADGMPDHDAALTALHGVPDVLAAGLGEAVWTLDVPPGSVIPGVTVSLPLAIPPHSAAPVDVPVDGLDVSHPVSSAWVSTVQGDAQKKAAAADAARQQDPRRLLCQDESTPQDAKSACGD